MEEKEGHDVPGEEPTIRQFVLLLTTFVVRRYRLLKLKVLKSEVILHFFLRHIKAITSRGHKPLSEPDMIRMGKNI